MCGGFTFTKNLLMALNMLYTLIGCLLIGIGTYARLSNVVINIEIVQIFILCGIFLALLSLVGLLGTSKHHQVLLFFYMLILFVLFLVQFTISCASLAVTDYQKINLAERGWQQSSNSTRAEAQMLLNCCGFDQKPSSQECIKVNDLQCCSSIDSCDCLLCKPKIVKAISKGLDLSGAVGLIFSFTEFFGVWLTIKFRNTKNPRAEASHFL